MEPERELTPDEEKLSRGIGVSFVIHGIILLLFTINAVFFTSEQIDFSQAVRVDIVGLPDKAPPKIEAPAKPEAKPELPEKPVDKPVEKAAEKTPPPPSPKPESVKVPKADEGVNLEKVKSKQQSALEKLKAMAALDKIKTEVESEKRKEAAKGKSDEGGQKVKGNILSPGTSLTGLAKLQHETYAVDLDAHIKQHWALPEWLAKRELKAQARVQIDSRGNILGRKIVKSSGNPSYDEEVLATIDRSAPFPAPPEKFIAIVSVDGILIGFPE